MRVDMDDGYCAQEGGRPEPVALLDETRIGTALPDFTLAKLRLRHSAAQMPSAVSRAVRRHPVRTFAIAFGVGWGLAKVTKALLRAGLRRRA